MRTSTATTMTLHVVAGPSASDRAAYVYVGNGKFEPCNAAAWREVDAWNQYAVRITARSAANRRSVQ